MDRAVDLLYQQPDQGALLLAQHGGKGTDTLLVALAGEVDAPLSKGRPISLAILRQLRGFSPDRIRDLAPRLAKQFSKLEMPRTGRLIDEERLAGKDVPEELRIALCAQYEVNQNLASILQDYPEGTKTIDSWKRARAKTSFFDAECR